MGRTGRIGLGNKRVYRLRKRYTLNNIAVSAVVLFKEWGMLPSKKSVSP